MILPKFTLRQALILVLVAGVVSIVLAAAWQGEEWAIGQTAALIAALVVSLIMAVAYWIFFLFGSFLAQRSNRKSALEQRTQVAQEAKS